MQLISVIIPYFQKEPGILRRALQSIANQTLPKDWQVDVIIVDDSSPHPASIEVESLTLPIHQRLLVVKQPNAGAAAARNRGLDEASPQTALIAFLDSDDIWPVDHLFHGVLAYSSGYDLCFSDNQRPGHHSTHIQSSAPKTAKAIAQASKGDLLIALPRASFAALVVEEFPTQASTVIYCASIAPNLRFDSSLGNCGEDVAFFAELATCSSRPCFNARSVVICGDGVNIFFSQFNWDGESFMTIQGGFVRCYSAILRIPGLPTDAVVACKKQLTKKRRDFAFHTLRRMTRNRGRIPHQTLQLIKEGNYGFIWFISSILAVLLLYPLGRYRP